MTKQFKKANVLIAICVFLFRPVAVLADGFGWRAGPFEFVLQTEDPVDDFVIVLSNVNTQSGPFSWKGGAYNKITHGASNTLIQFPRAALYDWTFAGRRSVTGYIEHPLYLTVEITVSPADDDKDGVNIFIFESESRAHKEEILSSDKPIRITVKMVKIEDYIKSLEPQPVGNEYKGELSDVEWNVLSENEKRAFRRCELWERNSYKERFFRYFLDIGQLKEKMNKYAPQLRVLDSLYLRNSKKLQDADKGYRSGKREKWNVQFLEANTEKSLLLPHRVDYPYEYIKQK